jgi:flagellar protein FliO/FliZ
MSFFDPSSMGPMVAALGAVLLIIWGVARLTWRHRARFQPVGRLGVRSVCAVDTRRRLVLVACDGREGLLLIGPAGDQFLGWLPGP